MAKKERNTGSAGRARAKRATPPNNERRERVGHSSASPPDRGPEDTACAVPINFADESSAAYASRNRRAPSAPGGEAILLLPVRCAQ
jgi:hypothetical protein